MVNRKVLIGGALALGGLVLTGCFPTGLDATFGLEGVQASPQSATAHDRFLAVTPGPTGTYYASGFVATGVGTDQAYSLARFTEDGAFDTTFGGGDGIATVNIAVGGKTVEQARGLSVQADGKIVLAGAVEHDVLAVGDAARDTDVAVARFDATGTLDPTFGTGGVKVLDLAPGFALDAGNYFGDLAWGVQSTTGNRTVIFGTKYAGPGKIESDFYLAALEEDGDLDPTFGTAGVLQVTTPGIIFDYARNLTIEPDGQLVTSGYSLSLDGVTRPFLIRANANGTLDTSFGGGTGYATDTVLGNVAESYKVGLQGDKYIAAGYGKANSADTNVDLIVYRFNQDGTRDLTFGTGGLVQIDMAGQDDRARNLQVLPDGRILAVGSTKLTASDIDAFTVLLSADGQLDPFYGNPPGNEDIFEFGSVRSDLGGTGDAWFGATLSTDAKAIYIVGYSAGVPGGNDNAAIARVSLENPDA